MRTKEQKRNRLIIIILILGFAIRFIGIDKIPNALNVDEASAGYEAYSILKTGMDRNGNTMPVFLEAWGSGQNVLLSYLILPFIQVLGLTVLAIRLPMAILGCISLIILYLLLKRVGNDKIALIGLAFFAICPWHIAKSRWGLESNLFPDLMLISIYLLVKGLQDKKKAIYYSSFLMTGLTAYSYGTSYFFLPLFIIPMVIILWKKGEINKKEACISLGIVTIITLPMILFVIINTLDWNQIKIGFMTIPKLEVNRYQEITTVFSGNFITNSLENFLESMKILLCQNDKLPWNSIFPYGTIYLYSSIFTVMGIVASFNINKEKKEPENKKINEMIEKDTKKLKINYPYLMNTWFLIALLLTFICKPNINRLNIIFIPIIYYTILGIYIFLLNKKKIGKIGLITIYLISFILFGKSYLKEDANKYYTFEGNIQEAIKYISTKTEKEIYITNKIKEPYIYVLFYTKYPTQDFIKTVHYQNPKAEFRQVTKFGNYHFTNIQELANPEKNIYLVKIQEIEQKNYDLSSWKQTKLGDYMVLEGEN